MAVSAPGATVELIPAGPILTTQPSVGVVVRAELAAVAQAELAAAAQVAAAVQAAAVVRVARTPQLPVTTPVRPAAR